MNAARTLMDVSREYHNLLLMADDAEGVLEGDLLEAFVAVEGEFNNKVDRALAIAETFRAKADAERARIVRIDAHAKALQNEAARLEGWVLQNMQTVEMTSIETANYVAKIARVAPSAQVEDVEFVAWAEHAGREDLLTRKPAPAPVPNKREILAALKRGEEMRGAVLVTDRVRLAVK